MVEKMTEEQLATLTTLFTDADKDEDGFINAMELGSIFAKLNEQKQPEQLEELVKVFSENGDFSKINLEEFIALRAQESGCFDLDEETKAAFKLFDKNLDGLISEEEFCEGLEALGHKYTAEQLHAMFKDADTNGDGSIDFQEFKKIMSD